MTQLKIQNILERQTLLRKSSNVQLLRREKKEKTGFGERERKQVYSVEKN